MNYLTEPNGVRALNQRIKNLAGSESLALRRRTTISLIIVGQMLPEGAVKGGSAMALRFGISTRFTSDLDAARKSELAAFRLDFEQQLRTGWGGFTGRLIELEPPSPAGVPVSYVMMPFEVKLEYLGKSWCTVPFELGHNEIGDVDKPDFVLDESLIEMFRYLGLKTPTPVPVMPLDHQIAQKLHACTQPGSDRARDLVDLQLLCSLEQLNLSAVRATCIRLFEYRKAHTWPPTLVASEDWATLYEVAAADLDVSNDLTTAMQWLAELIVKIEKATVER